MEENEEEAPEEGTKTVDDVRTQEIDIYRAISELDQEQEPRPFHHDLEISDPIIPTLNVPLIPAEASKPSNAVGPYSKNFSRLPSRILTKIFEMIPINQHEELKLVSPHWHAFIDRHLGVPIYIGKFSEFTDTDEPSSNFEFSPVSDVSEKGISFCYMSNMHHLPVPTFKYPNLVRKIYIIDYISEGYFLKILQPLTNLRHLALDLSTLHYLEFLNISLDFLTRLEHLQIANEEYSNNWNDEIHPSRNEVRITLDNTYSLLSVRKFKCLNHLFVGFPICSPDCRNSDLVLAIFQCLLNHSSTIRSLEVFFEGDLQSTEDDDEPDTSVELEAFDISTMSVVKLQRITINLQNPHQEMELVEPWLAFLNTQTELQLCCFLPHGPGDDNAVELPLPRETIATNAPTLTVFRWFLEEDWTRTTHVYLNCEIFQPCVHLYEIHIAATGSLPSTLDNVHTLPLTLKNIVIEGINIRKMDVEAMATNLPLLEKLSLSSIGQGAGFGMSMSTLKGIYERKTLKRIVVNYGFNSESLRETTAENNSFSFILMLLKTKAADDDDAYFHMQLCDNGTEWAIIP